MSNALFRHSTITIVQSYDLRRLSLSDIAIVSVKALPEKVLVIS